jgi:SAM-dependent methyltransferase
VNQDFHQYGMDLSDRALRDFPTLQKFRDYYDAPYTAVKPKDVLVVGSGMGNDVAAALRAGARHVDAVDIDPVIVGLGRRMHQEKPYGDPRVSVYVTDARSFFNSSHRKYDLIAFSLLDSHVVFSSHTSLRLDNFVYTVDSFRQAKKLLNSGGVVAVSFSFNKPWIRERMGLMLEKAFGHPPTSLSERTFIISNKESAAAGTAGAAASGAGVSLPTDDWPFLYSQKKEVPRIYLYVLLMIFVVSLAFMPAVAPGSLRRLDAHFFFLGAAFMLLEARSISQLALLFGSTWIVNSIVITAVLAMIFFANLIAGKWKGIPRAAVYPLLFASVLLVYFFPMDIFAGMSYAARVALAPMLLAVPLFFAGIIFAVSFRDTDDVPAAFASNMIGAVAGGLFEYSSFVFGLRALCLFALAFYLISAVPLLTKRKQ